MPVLKPRLRRAIVPVAVVIALAGVASGAVALTSSSNKHGDFAVSDFMLPAVPAGSELTQSVTGLWFGSNPSEFSKVSGADWLTVSDTGVISGTAPAQALADPAVITIKANDGGDAKELNVEVPVLATGQLPRIEAASWNLSDAGANASHDARQKEIQAIVANNIQVVGLQETNGTAAMQLAADLGWYHYQSSGDLGIVSAYPISDVTAPTATTPAAGVTLDVDGLGVRVWTAHLDEGSYGPYQACFGGVTQAAQLIAAEKATTRYTQASAIASEIAPDLAAAASTPVLFLGDLASPASSDWTAATAASHCSVGAVDWPVPDVFTAAGLTDSYRVAVTDPVSTPGNTWSPLQKEHQSPAGLEPQDRIDYVFHAGPLDVLGAESLYQGWMGSTSGDVVSDWPSDHAAAVTLFQLTGGSPLAHSTATSTPPSVTKPTKPVVKRSFVKAKPKISGRAKLGATLHVVVGTWSPRPTFSYQWYAAGKSIHGATKATYKIPRKYLGKKITVRVTGTKAGYTKAVVSSAPVKVVK